MASKGSLNLFELHVEKIVLGISVAATLAVAVYFALGPNKAEYGGQKLGPRELDEAILHNAQSLQEGLKRVKVEPVIVPKYAKQLRDQFETSLFAARTDGGPALAQELPRAAAFGEALPVIEDITPPVKNIPVVTPLKPTPLAARTGSSVVQRREATLAGLGTGAKPAGPAKAAGEEEAVPVSWVTIGGYWPVDAQKREMTKLGYEGYRVKVDVVGADAQRSELLPSGQFSEWQDVEPSKAMTQIKIPPPLFDEKTGDLLNQSALDQALEQVKAAQKQIMEPAFYPVKAGDVWKPPPLPGHEDEEESDDDTGTPKVKDTKEKKQKEPKPMSGGGGRGAAPAGPVGGGRGAAPAGPTGGGGRMGGPVGGGPTGMAPPRPTGPSPGQVKAEARKVIQQNLKDAEKALEDKNYSQAEQLAQGVANNQDATSGDKSRAQKIIDKAKKELEKAGAAGGGPAVGGGPSFGRGAPPGYPPVMGRMGPMAGPGMSGPQPMAQEAGIRDWLKNPEKDEFEPAVWFHDETVEPGKTYRYRMRVKLWNRYVGRRASLSDPAAAAQAVLLGEWSLPSDPISVPPKTHFFVKSGAFGKPAASIEVFTWHKGKWLKETFEVQVGDVMGGTKPVKVGEDEKGKAVKEDIDFSTGAVVLDLRTDEPVLVRTATGKKGEFSYRDTKSLVLVYLDPADGQVKERVQALERNDRTYKKLKAEAEK